MEVFEKMRFSGTFRDYQRRVLDSAPQYLKDGKLNVVAAPGSGKTVLGLELIRRIGKPCVILSPTTAIRGQWGARLRGMFLESDEDFAALYSEDLRACKAITSVTYQALYAACERQTSEEDGERADYTGFDLFAALAAQGVGAVCLDEAHHLRNEWQKALEKFLAALGDIKLIALTATPPYDAEGGEWARFIETCGEVDEEIFVPELVAKDTLCPHQDYVYFNYPSKEETAALARHRASAAAAVEEVCALDFLTALCGAVNDERDYDRLYSSAAEYISLLSLFAHCGLPVRKKLIRALTVRGRLPRFDLHHAERAIGFLLDSDLTDAAQKASILDILRAHGVCERRKVKLVLTEKLRRTLLSSVGKLDCIAKIAQAERAALGESLRMLVLTDYINREGLERIATEKKFSAVNIVSIFETLRRAGAEGDIGVLSGGLVILPSRIDLSAYRHTRRPIAGTDYDEIAFAGSNRDAVDIVGGLFARGEIRILVGTKSLLGEGWDSPCINSLVLASFVGSFVLSNQMRGRAIRIDPARPDKVANIWHLVTAEPTFLVKEKAGERLAALLEEDENVLCSQDFDTLARRFDCFMGPDYETGEIVSGIGRIRAIAPPYDAEGIARIDAEMLARAAKREEVAKVWKAGTDGAFEVTLETRANREKRVPVYTFVNILLFCILLAAESALLSAFFIAGTGNPLFVLLAAAAQTVLAYFFFAAFRRLALHFNPARSIATLGRAVCDALRKSGQIAKGARAEAHGEKELLAVSVCLRGASVHDQNIFNAAMAELLSPIENPRYILIGKGLFGRKSYGLSFACPSALGKNKECAQIFEKELKGACGGFFLVYTRTEEGRRLILECRKSSYITKNHKLLDRQYKVRRTE